MRAKSERSAPAAEPAHRAGRRPWWHRLLFRLEPETAHHLAILALRGARLLPGVPRRLERAFACDGERLGQDLLGTRFPAPVGLAAGFDKDGLAIRGLAALGFGSIEVGTVTPRAQRGNPRPRLFRYAAEETLRNAMGFNNAGGEALARRLGRWRTRSVPVGVNVGRNRTTPPERAAEDYLSLVARFGDLCDYLAINVSSPNTPGLRDLQDPSTVRSLVREGRTRTRTPLLVKLSPDLEATQAVEISEAAVEEGAAGVILTNTTVDYSLLPGTEERGGLSGRVLRERSFSLLRAVAPRLFGRAVLVSVGGVDSGAEAYRRLRAGASLVQLYSALVFRGPGVAAEIHRSLLELLDRDGFDSIAAAVGADL